MNSVFSEARRRPLARLDEAKPPTARAAIAFAKLQAYQDAADAPATLRAYAADLPSYKAWCERHEFDVVPATPAMAGAYLEQQLAKATPCLRCDGWSPQCPSVCARPAAAWHGTSAEFHAGMWSYTVP